MDEQRMQAYVALIQQLLSCPQGQEMTILQANAELVDAGLLSVMQQVADYLESQGDRSAEWLRGLAAHLAEALQAETGAATEVSSDLESAAQFLWETLQLVSGSRGDPQQVYRIWAQQQEQLNAELLAVMPQVIAPLLAGEVEQRTSMAAVLLVFGNLINEFPLGTRWINLELGITAYQHALQVYTRDAFPQDWATTQNNLATAYSERVREERADNLEQAITAYLNALQVRTRIAFPQGWADTQNNLANTYLYRVRGERADNLEKAIEACQLALQVRTRDAFPQGWADTQNNLANTYLYRVRGERADNLEKAIEACQLALQVYTCDAFSEQWAMTQHNLADAYHNRIRGERADNLEKAITAYLNALQVYTRDAFPQRWAYTQNNLANTYLYRIRGERADNLEQSIAACKLALQVYTRDAFSEQWAMTQSTLANAYSNCIRGERADNLEQSIAACKLALQVYTRDAFSEQWAMTQSTLANAYSNCIRGERADNLERAITAYLNALQVRTHNDFSEQWAMTQNNLATAYGERIRGDQADNLEKAIEALQLALKVYTCDTFPEQWAMTQNNLATAYHNRIRGDQADNLEKAIGALQLALEVYTRDAFPNACRGTARNLGNLHFDQKNWANAAAIYKTALGAAEVLYKACILLDGKAAELSETADLPRRTAYALARRGSLQQAVEVLESGRARGLSESLDRDRANLEQLQQLAPTLYNQYKDLTQQIRNLEVAQRDRDVSSDRHALTPRVLSNTATQLYSELDTTITQIRQVEGYADFLDQLNFKDIQPSLQPNRPLVYLVTTTAGSLALIVNPNGITDLWLDDLTETSVIDLLDNTWFKAYDQFQSDRQAWFDAIDQGARRLWELLMQPLIQHLKTHDFHHAILIPTGYLSFLPLHAAWTEDPSTPTGRHYALDDIHFTYTPNAKSLTVAPAIAAQTTADTILAIDNPTQDLKLRYSKQEVQAAIAHFQQPTTLQPNQATINAVRSQLAHHTIAHFTCHGTANLNAPLNSGLLMSDGLLTLRDILALNLSERGGLRLAILSACETGLSGIENADEAISLPTGLLQAGVAAVIASLWLVDDLSTMLLLSKFYELWRTKNKEPSEALRQAQVWLRDSTAGEIADFGGLLTPNRNDRPYTHPFYWAAFNYTGI